MDDDDCDYRTAEWHEYVLVKKINSNNNCSRREVAHFSDMSSLPSSKSKKTWHENLTVPFVLSPCKSDTGHRNQLLSLIAELRNQNILCDVYLQCDDGTIFSAHKLILASVSPYFEAMFNSNMVEKKRAIIDIKDVQSCALKTLIDFAYTTQIVVSLQDIYDVLVAANMFCFKDVESKIIEFLCNDDRIDLSNCVDVFTVAVMINSEELSLAANSFIASHFRYLMRDSTFLELSLQQLDLVLSNEDINVISEVEIFDAVMTWIKYDATSRITHLPQLLCHIRFALMTRKYLVDVVLRENLIMRQDECRNIVLKALDHHMLPERTIIDEDDPSFIPRHLSHRDLFVLGGQVNGKCRSSVESFDFKTNSWSPVTPMKQARAYSTAVSLDGNLYVVGGVYEKTDLNTVEKYDPSMEAWCEVASLRKCKGALSVCVVDGWIYAVGGSNGRNTLNTVEQYDSILNTWTELPTMRLPRSHFSMCEMNGYIYSIGGYCGISEVSHCEYFDPTTKKWNEITGMNKSRMGHVAVCSKHRLYVFGGKNSMGRLDSIEKYNPELNMWLVIKTNFNMAPLGSSICLGLQLSQKEYCGKESKINIMIVGGIDEGNKKERKEMNTLMLKSSESEIHSGVSLLEERAFAAMTLL